jgi:large subunit ribosomal protein L25
MAENSEQFTIKAEMRQGRGKNDARRLRANGKIPVMIYGGDGETIAATARLADLAAIIRSRTGASTIFKVAIDGEETEVMFHDRQIDPLKGRMIHADLKRIVRGQKLEVTVPLELVGEPVGVRIEGGLLDRVLHEIEIRCRPSQIPQSVEVDVSNLHAKEVLHVGDIKVDEEIEIITDPKAVVATIKFAKAEEEETQTGGDEETSPSAENES